MATCLVVNLSLCVFESDHRVRAEDGGRFGFGVLHGQDQPRRLCHGAGEGGNGSPELRPRQREHVRQRPAHHQ